MPFRWPDGFPRVPTEDWVSAPLDTLAVKYDSVERHGWYANLDPTVEEVQDFVRGGDVVVDYSGGTGILIDRLLAAMPHHDVGFLNIDSSPKFLRLCLEKFRGEERVAFRLLRYLKDQRRLQFADEVLGKAMVERGADAVISTNAIHLYYDLPDTLRSWWRILRPEGRCFLQSGNVRLPLPEKDRWIIDDTVDAIARVAAQIVRRDPRYQAYRAVLDDGLAMAHYGALRRRIFLPPRPLDHYERALHEAGFEILGVRTRPIRARTDEWYEFLAVYHEGILGWVGGTEKIAGSPPTQAAVHDRLALIREAMDEIFHGSDAFDATWTYITCRKRAQAG